MFNAHLKFSIVVIRCTCDGSHDAKNGALGSMDTVFGSLKKLCTIILVGRSRLKFLPIKEESFTAT